MKVGTLPEAGRSGGSARKLLQRMLATASVAFCMPPLFKNTVFCEGKRVCA